MKLSDKEMKNIQQEILKGYEQSNHAKTFTVNVNLQKGSSQQNVGTKYFCEKDPNSGQQPTTFKVQPQQENKNVKKTKKKRKKKSKKTERARGSNALPEAKKRNSTKEQESITSEFIEQAFDTLFEHQRRSEAKPSQDSHAESGKEKGEEGNRTADKERSRTCGKKGESGSKKRKKSAEGSRPAKGRSEKPATTKRLKQKGDNTEFRNAVQNSDQERRKEDARGEVGQESAVLGPKHTPPVSNTQSTCNAFSEQGEKKRRKGDAMYMECIKTLGSSGRRGHSQQKLEEQGKQQQQQQNAEHPGTEQKSASEGSSFESGENAQSHKENSLPDEASLSLTQDNASMDSSKVSAGENTKNNVNGEKSIDITSKIKDKEIDTKTSDLMAEGRFGADSEGARKSSENRSDKSTVKILDEQKSNIEAAIKGSDVENLQNRRTTPTSGKMAEDTATIDENDHIRNVEEKKVNPAQGDLYTTAAGSSILEAKILSVMTDGSVQELSDERCKHINGLEALILRNKRFSAWISMELKNIE